MRITAVTTAVPSLQKPRLLGFIRCLRLAGHEVSVVATTDLSQGGRSTAPDSAIALLEDMGVGVTYVPYRPTADQLARAIPRVALRRVSSETALYLSASLARKVTAAVEATDPDVLHVERPRAVPLVYGCDIPYVVDITDPRLGAYRHYRHSSTLAPFSVGVAELMRARLDRYPAAREEIHGLVGVPVLVASDTGRDVLLRSGADPNLLRTVPNAVFRDERAEPLTAQDARIVLGMSGNLSYPPNVLGFHRLAKGILPHVRGALDARIVVIGAAPHRALLRSAERAGAEVHADVRSVPETIRELAVSAMLSPQTVSAGHPNRVVDAVYRAGVPIVASPETLGGAPSAVRREIPVAVEPEEWLEQLHRVLAGGSRREAVVRGQEAIEGACGPEVVGNSLVEAYRLARAQSRSPA